MPTLKQKFDTAMAVASEASRKSATSPGDPAARAEFVAAVAAAKRANEQMKLGIEGDAELAALNNLGGGGVIYDPTVGRKSVMQLKSLHTAAVTGQSLRTEIPTKDILGGGFGLPAVVSPNIVRGDYPANLVRLSDLFSQEIGRGPTVRVYRVSNVATAGQVAEGAVKPLSGLVTDHEDITMLKFAVRDRISREAIEDYGAFQSVLTSELLNSVITKMSGYAVSTAMGASGIQLVTNASLIDGVAVGKSQLLGTTGWAPTAIVANPVDIAVAEQAKASTAGTYMLDVLGSGPEQIHGVPLVSSPAMPPGTWLMGAFPTAGTWFTRENVSISSGLDGPDFSENMTSIVIETRCALGVTRASHLVSGKFA